MEIETKRKIALAFTRMLKLGVVGYVCILACVIISNLSLFRPNWPFALFASYSQSLMLALPVVLVVSLMSWRAVVLPMALLAIFAFYPFYSFDKFVEPTGKVCIPNDCVSVVAANLRHHPEALVGLAQTQAVDVDILIIIELPRQTTSEELLALFPMQGEAKVELLTEPQLQIGSRLAVISRKPLDGMTLQLKQFPKPKRFQRGIVRFNYETASGKPLSFVVVHPPPPKDRAATVSRDAYLYAASETLSGRSDFIMIGDFNMTPWESAFDALPGKRAGDPRWIRTWNARKFWHHIPIDHAMVGDGVSVLETEVLQDIGSDHYPIRVLVQRKN